MSDKVDLARLKAAVGYLYGTTPDPRIDLPLEEQVELLMEWACSPTPANFTRSVPVRATDHDELISWALTKLIAVLGEVAALLPDLVDDGDCWFDHHGGCQEHGYLGLQPGETCPQADLKALVARLCDEDDS